MLKSGGRKFSALPVLVLKLNILPPEVPIYEKLSLTVMQEMLLCKFGLYSSGSEVCFLQDEMIKVIINAVRIERIDFF